MCTADLWNYAGQFCSEVKSGKPFIPAIAKPTIIVKNAFSESKWDDGGRIGIEVLTDDDPSPHHYSWSTGILMLVN